MKKIWFTNKNLRYDIKIQLDEIQLTSKLNTILLTNIFTFLEVHAEYNEYILHPNTGLPYKMMSVPMLEDMI